MWHSSFPMAQSLEFFKDFPGEIIDYKQVSRRSPPGFGCLRAFITGGES
jgi:hypothetical protein